MLYMFTYLSEMRMTVFLPAYVTHIVVDSVDNNNDNKCQTISKGLWACFRNRECDEDLHDGIPLYSRLDQVERPPEQRKYKYPSLCLQASQNRWWVEDLSWSPWDTLSLMQPLSELCPITKKRNFSVDKLFGNVCVFERESDREYEWMNIRCGWRRSLYSWQPSEKLRAYFPK